MNCRIRRADIEAFKINAQSITLTEITNPILTFLKVEVLGDNCSITKSDLKSFVVHTFSNDSEDCCFLVDENILFNFIELSQSEFINFSINGLRIDIYDDRHKTASATDNEKLYPFIDLSNKEWTQISQAALGAIGICAQIVFNDEISGIRNSVMIGEGCIAGSDATIGYLQEFNERLPIMVLRKPVAIAVGKLKQCEYSNNNSYDLFRSGFALFGFCKSEIQFVNLKPIFQKIGSKLDFYANKSLLIKWCTYAINSTKSKLLAATWKGNGARLDLEIVDAKFEINTNSYIDVVDGKGFFKFNPETINQILKVLPAEQIYFYPGENRMYMTDLNRSFLAVIMLIN